MWQFFDTKILHVSDGNAVFDWQFFPVDTWNIDGHILHIPCTASIWPGYDAWVQDFSPQYEINLLQEQIEKALQDPTYRAHIRGISLAESVELLRSYYKQQGYEDLLAKNYLLPKETQITASISLRHALWSEKDKRFLGTYDSHKKPYSMISPPLRTSHDLRVLQQGLRMNCIMGIEVFPGDEHLIPQLLEREILSPFGIAQMIQFRWKYFGR